MSYNNYNQNYGQPNGGWQQHGHPTAQFGCPPNQQSYSNAPAGGYQAQSSYGQPNHHQQGSGPQGYNNTQGSAYPPGQASGATGDRGMMGALAGGAAGGMLGKKNNHGFLGTVGGAIMGSLLEDAAKKKKHGRH